MKPGLLSSKHQMSESLRLALLLSLSGGLQDAYTYTARNKVFANAQTGNIVLLFHKLLEGDYSGGLRYIFPLLSFTLGVAAAEIIHLHCKNMKFLHWRQLVLCLEIALLTFSAFVPGEAPILANCAVSFSCALQVQAFRKVHGYAFASTMCIGDIRSGTEALVHFFKKKERQYRAKAAAYFSVILFFGLGAWMGGYFLPFLGLKTILLSSALLFLAFLFMFFPGMDG